MEIGTQREIVFKVEAMSAWNLLTDFIFYVELKESHVWDNPLKDSFSEGSFQCKRVGFLKIIILQGKVARWRFLVADWGYWNCILFSSSWIKNLYVKYHYIWFNWWYNYGMLSISKSQNVCDRTWKGFLILLDCFSVYSLHMHENPWATTEDYSS